MFLISGGWCVVVASDRLAGFVVAVDGLSGFDLAAD